MVRMSFAQGAGFTAVLAGALAASVLPMSAFGQDKSAAEESVAVVVTGSRIRHIQQEGPSPVITIDAKEMEQRGYATVTDALNDLPQNAGGGFDQQTTFGFTPSASAVDLRGFGAGRTLVLIDGRRQPMFPLAFDGIDNFVDLSSIPVGAIERIEILTDGASAIYGSDAIGGVINIILKKKADKQLSLREADTTHGGGGQTRVQLSTGAEDAHGGNAALFMEYYKQRALMFSQRSYSRSDRLGGINGAGPGVFSSFGDPGTFLAFDGTDLTPVAAINCDTSGGSPGVTGGFCRFNRAQYRELLPSWDQFSVTGKYERPLNETAQFFGKLAYFRSETDTQMEPMAYDQAGADGFGILTPANALSNPLNPAADPNNDYPDAAMPGVWRRRLVEFGPRTQNVKNDTYSLLTGLRGKLNERFDWELGLSYVEQRVKTRYGGYARKDALNQLVYGADADGDGVGDGGTLNLFNPIPQSVVDAVGIEPVSKALSSVAGVDLEVRGKLFDLPQGAAQFAVVTEFNKQRFEDLRGVDQLSGNVISLGGTNGKGDRQYTAVGVEMEFPIAPKLTLNLASRFDDYNDDSDVGSAVSPRLALQYRPLRQLLIRGSAGKSFRAPDMQRLFGGATTQFTDVVDTPKCIADGGSGRGDTSVASCTTVAQAIQTSVVGNVHLKEETGKNYAAGVVWEPLGGITLSADFFRITLEDIVNTPSTQFLLDRNAEDGSFADAIQRNSAAQDPNQNPGGLVLITQAARNLSFQKMSGVDLRSEIKLPVEELGSFTFNFGATYLDRIDIREQPDDVTVNVLKDGTLGQFVRFRGTAEVSWKRGIFGSNLLLSYIGPFTPSDPTSFPKVGSWATVNVSGTLETPWNSTVVLGVNNLFDRNPPLDLQGGDSGQPFYNQTFHDSFGAMWRLTYTQRF